MDRILGFDGIRALAAISVILTHTAVFKALLEQGWLSTAFVHSVNGEAGVQAFFVLSGFLITSLLLIEHKKNGRISLYNFYVRRSLRIFPLYFLVVSLIAIFNFLGENVTNYKSLTFAALYSYNFIPLAWYSSVLGHTWSLAVEEHFYIIWPFIFISLTHRFKKLILLLLASIVFSLGLAIILANIDWLNQNFFIKRWSFIAGANIAMGALVALLMHDDQLKFKVANFFKNNTSIFIAIIFIFNELATIEENYYISQYIRGLGFAVLVGWIAHNQQSKLTRALEIPPLNYLGKISYGIYMYQGFFLATGPYRAANQTWPPDQSIGLVLLIIAAPLSFHYFEKPLIRLKHKLQRDVT